MILNQTNRNIERSGIRVEREATIQADAVAFKVLSDMLYPDKPLAIIRELLCNAYDSHTDAGTPDRPVDIHLPNIMEPYLSIRDYGLGLSFRDACILMLTYFKSTKRDNNKVTGALGLGSKTPFSYVDSYTVTTRFNGRKFTFNAFINEGGNPAMALLAREFTDEENGVEIMVPVRRSDFSVFTQRAETVIQWFAVPPNVSGSPDFKIPTHDYELSGSNWKIAKDHHRYNYNALAIQGNIAYPISASSMPQLPAGYNELLRLPIHFTFPIGSISFTAGRDAISYDKQTVENLLDAFDTLTKELPLKFQKEFDACATAWEARCLYSKLISNSTSGSALHVMASGKLLEFKWKGTLINSSSVLIDLTKVPDTLITSFWGERRSSTYGLKVKDSIHSGNQGTTINCHTDTVILIDDLPRGSIARTRLFRKERGNYSGGIYLISSSNDTEIKYILKSLGSPPVIKTSSLPKPPRASAISKSTVRKFNQKHSASTSRFINLDDDLDMTEGGFYIPLLRDKAIDSDRREITQFNTIVFNAYKMGLLDGNEIVFGASPKVLNQFKLHADWQNIIDVLRERLKKQIAGSNVTKQIASISNFNEWHRTGGYEAYRQMRFSDLSKLLDANHGLVKFFNEVVKFGGVRTDQTDTMATLLNVDIAKSACKPDFDFGSTWKKEMKKYPMMLTLQYTQSSAMPIIVDYITTMDKMATLQEQV